MPARRPGGFPILIINMTASDLPRVFSILKKEYARWEEPIVTRVAAEKRPDPFKVLISTIISLRTKDAVTEAATGKLWKLASTPEEMAQLSPAAIEKAIFPAGFYHTKAVNIIGIANEIIEKYGGKVPDDIDLLVQMKGVGRKTANLVVTKAYGKPGICVDTHVHRITNRWGYVKTREPNETEMALRAKLPGPYWIIINDLLVSYGQHLCVPVSPFCSRCKMVTFCKRVGVKKYR